MSNVVCIVVVDASSLASAVVSALSSKEARSKVLAENTTDVVKKLGRFDTCFLFAMNMSAADAAKIRTACETEFSNEQYSYVATGREAMKQKDSDKAEHGLLISRHSTAISTQTELYRECVSGKEEKAGCDRAVVGAVAALRTDAPAAQRAAIQLCAFFGVDTSSTDLNFNRTFLEKDAQRLYALMGQKSSLNPSETDRRAASRYVHEFVVGHVKSDLTERSVDDNPYFLKTADGVYYRHGLDGWHCVNYEQLTEHKSKHKIKYSVHRFTFVYDYSNSGKHAAVPAIFNPLKNKRAAAESVQPAQVAPARQRPANSGGYGDRPGDDSGRTMSTAPQSNLGSSRDSSSPGYYRMPSTSDDGYTAPPQRPPGSDDGRYAPAPAPGRRGAGEGTYAGIPGLSPDDFGAPPDGQYDMVMAHMNRSFFDDEGDDE